MNQQCKVCGEPAAGFHFGAFTCEGCKSFFGRTYNNLGSISECKNGGVCVINKKNRTACKACRLRKCLMVGMSKSGSRYGRRSNWFKIHCLLQEQSNSSQSAAALGATHFGPGFLPGFLPGLQSQTQQNLLYAAAAQGKEAREQSSPSQEDHLALQSHLLHVAMLKQKSRERGATATAASDKSPRPDDLSLQGQLKLLTWREEECRPGPSPPRASPPSIGYAYKDLAPGSSLFPGGFAKEAAAATAAAVMAHGSFDVFRPFLPLYRRTETPSDSGASSAQESDEQDRDSTRSGCKREGSPLASGREPPRRKIDATVTLAPGDLLRHGPGLAYPPTELVTPAPSQRALLGGDLLLASPSPGGLAVEQCEPIDLSVRAGKAFLQGRRRSGQGTGTDAGPAQPAPGDAGAGELAAQEPPAKSNPLDLSLDVKRPAAEVSH